MVGNGENKGGLVSQRVRAEGQVRGIQRRAETYRGRYNLRELVNCRPVIDEAVIRT